MRKRNCVQINVEAIMIVKRKKKMTIQERNAYEEAREYQSMATARIYLTKRSESVKVTLPKLKFMEKEYV